jgi:hypothetical protein
MPPAVIEHLVFLIHPMTWRAVSGSRTRDIPYDDYLDCEEIVAARWRAGIEAMADRPNEAFVLISPSPPDDLSDQAIVELGPRALILREYVPDGEPDEHTHPNSCKELVPRLLHMAVGHGLEFSPDISAVTWGESSAGCAANYGRYLATLLDMNAPSDMLFDMTVPDELFMHPMVIDSMTKPPVLAENSPLGRPVQLYTWEAENDLQVAWYHNALAVDGDTPLRVRIDLPGCDIEVRSYGELLWPGDGSLCREEDGKVVLPIWGEPVGEPVWGKNFIFARGIDADPFRAAMTGVEIEEG